MAIKKSNNILGQSGNFHRNTYLELHEKGILNKEMGEAEQKRILDNHYKSIGYTPKDYEITQIYNLGIKKIRNIEEKKQGKRDVLSEEKKDIQSKLDRSEEIASKNRTGTQKFRNKNREFNKKYDNWRAERALTDEKYKVDRNNPNEVVLINEFLKYLKEEKGYKDSTIDNYRQAIHTEQEDIWRKGIEQQKQQLKFERHFTKLTENRRLPIEVSPENMGNFIKLSNHMNKIFVDSRTQNRQGDVKKFQQSLVLAAYMAEVKGYGDPYLA